VSRKTTQLAVGIFLAVVVVAAVLFVPRLPGVGDSASRVLSQVFISEVHYNDPTGLVSEDFVEILNSGQKDVSLAGWCLRGVDFCFTDKTVLQAGTALAVTGTEFSGKLNNSGETLQLTDAVDNIIDEVRYSGSAPWPTFANGRGQSLHRITRDSEVPDLHQWVSDVPSPSVAYDATFRYQQRESVAVVITEIYYHSPNNDPNEEFIEVTNVSALPVPMAGWCIPEIDFCFTESDVLAPNESRALTGFGSRQLSNSDGVIRLLDAAKTKRDIVYYEDKNQWPALADGHGMSLHRRNSHLWGIEPGNWEAKPPSPGVSSASASSAYLTSFDDVVFTKSPLASQPIDVTALMSDGKSATLHYRLNFEPEIEIPMQKNIDGRWGATIPQQPAGTLVRFRISNLGNIKEGSWPRSGDGMTYRGTVVKTDTDGQLPQLDWFVKDSNYEQIYNDRDLYGDNGYPTVIAFNGEVFDRAMIRIRGNQSRLNEKRKWKVILPAGYETDLGGLLDLPVNEFALNSAVTDKSFVREILTSELQKMGGGIGQQVFPLRFVKNNEFYGLYLYQEQPDGRWRDKFNFSDAVVSFKSDRQATLNPNQLDLPDSELRARYQRRTQRWVQDAKEIRELITQVNNENKAAVLDFVYQHLDVPQIVEAMATMRVAQHLEWEHKNHLLLFDPADKKWRLVPIDFDLNFGRRYVSGCNSLCEEVSASGYMEYMEGNRLGRLFLKTPELREMLDRRTRTLADLFLTDGHIEQRIEYWNAQIQKDAQKDRKIWFTYGEQYSVQKGQDILLKDYVLPKRKLFLGPESQRLPAAQVADISYSMTGESIVTIRNSESVAIDISGVKLASLNSRVPAGTVLLPGRSAIFSVDRLYSSPLEKGQMHIWITPEQ